MWCEKPWLSSRSHQTDHQAESRNSRAGRKKRHSGTRTTSPTILTKSYPKPVRVRFRGDGHSTGSVETNRVGHQMDQQIVENNAVSRRRLRDSSRDSMTTSLQQMVGADWTVASVLAHLAFWDQSTSVRWEDYARGGELLGFPDRVIDVVNAANLPTWLALPGRTAVDLALQAAETVGRPHRTLPCRRGRPGHGTRVFASCSSARATARAFGRDRAEMRGTPLDRLGADQRTCDHHLKVVSNSTLNRETARTQRQAPGSRSEARSRPARSASPPATSPGRSRSSMATPGSA